MFCSSHESHCQIDNYKLKYNFTSTCFIFLSICSLQVSLICELPFPTSMCVMSLPIHFTSCILACNSPKPHIKWVLQM